MNGFPSLSTNAGLGVSRGRFQGWIELAWPGSAQDCEPRDEATNPRPGITGELEDPSLGVAENTFP
jgi:hypothetical protein